MFAIQIVVYCIQVSDLSRDTGGHQILASYVREREKVVVSMKGCLEINSS